MLTLTEYKLENYTTLIESIGLKAFSATLCSNVSSRNSVGQRVSCYGFWSLSTSINIWWWRRRYSPKPCLSSPFSHWWTPEIYLHVICRSHREMAAIRK